MRAFRMARVYYLPAHADLLVARVTSWAAMGDPVERGPGLDQGDAVQFVAHMAYLQHTAQFGTTATGHFAWYSTTSGQFWGVYPAGKAPKRAQLASQRGIADAAVAVPMWGEEPFRKPAYGSGQMGESWPRDLALACNTVIRKVAKAEQGPAVVPGWGGEYPGGAVPIPGAIGVGGIAVIVAGAAVAVIGSFAAWRYFSPEVRIQAAAVATAARAYETRLRAMISNGVELPPSPIELFQAEAVRSAAKESQSKALLVGAGTCAGIGIGATLLGYIRSRQEAA